MARPANHTRWVLFATVSLLLLAAVLALFRAPPVGIGPVPRQPPAAGVQMARPTGADDVLKDEALIRDLRPLFLPTEFNAVLPEPRREPGRTILDEERPRWHFSEGELALSRELPVIAVINRKPAELAAANDVLEPNEIGLGALGFGRGRRESEALAERGGFVEILAVATGERVLADALPPDLAPAGGKPWEPMELFAAVDTAGLAAPLVVTEGSRVDEVDAHFRKVLAQAFARNRT
jgi:hypothetical protein